MNRDASTGQRTRRVLTDTDGRGVVRLSDRLPTDPDDLWSALTEPDRLRRWLGEVTGDLREGGEFDARYYASGWEGHCVYLCACVCTTACGALPRSLRRVGRRRSLAGMSAPAFFSPTCACMLLRAPQLLMCRMSHRWSFHWGTTPCRFRGLQLLKFAFLPPERTLARVPFHAASFPDPAECPRVQLAYQA